MAALGALAAVAAGMAVASPSAQAADPTSSNGASAGSDPASRERAFAAASAEYGVPRTVLEAVSYAQTRWDFNPGHSTSGGYGPMHLVDANLGSAAEGRGLGDAPAPAPAPAADTLGRAATLTGLPEAALRTDERANIRGGAALLAATQKRLGLPTGASTDAGQWYAAVADASGLDRAGRRLGLRRRRLLRHRLRRLAADRRRQAGLARPLEREAAGRPGRPARPAQEAERRPRRLPARTRLRVGPRALPGRLGARRLRQPRPREPPAPRRRSRTSSSTTPRRPTTRRSSSRRTRRTSLALHPALLRRPRRPAPPGQGRRLARRQLVRQRPLDRPRARGLRGDRARRGTPSRCTAPRPRWCATSPRSTTSRSTAQHIIGHDKVPGTTPRNVAGMHWDPGPYWDWEHYFELLGAPLQSHTVRCTPRTSSASCPASRTTGRP